MSLSCQWTPQKWQKSILTYFWLTSFAPFTFQKHTRLQISPFVMSHPTPGASPSWVTPPRASCWFSLLTPCLSRPNVCIVPKKRQFQTGTKCAFLLINHARLLHQSPVRKIIIKWGVAEKRNRTFWKQTKQKPLSVDLKQHKQCSWCLSKQRFIWVSVCQALETCSAPSGMGQVQHFLRSIYFKYSYLLSWKVCLL